MNEAETEFEEIHDAFRPRILRYLGRLVGKSEAEDLTQEVFAKVHKALSGVHHQIVLAEEQHLRHAFGESYLAYC